MTAEQKEAIKICTHYKNILYACNCEEGPERTGKAIETVLNLIQEQEAELKKKDKIINLIAKAFKQDDVRSVEEIKQYFERESRR